MSKETKLRFAATIEQLGVIYQTEITDLLLRAYWQALQDVPIDDLEREAASHITLSKFFPKPCELRGEDAEADSVRAWDSAIAAIHQHGMYRHVDFEDAVVNAVIRYLGGWPEFCCFDPSDEQWRRKEFIATYRALSRTGLSKEQAGVLTGISESNFVKRDNGTIVDEGIIVRKIHAPKPIRRKEMLNVEHKIS